MATLEVPVFVPVPSPEPGRRRRRSVAERALLVAIALVLALVAGGVVGIFLTHSHPARHHPPAGQRRVVPVTTPTTSIPPAPAQNAAASPSPATQSAPGVAPPTRAGGSTIAYIPGGVVDPSPVATATVPSLPLYASPDSPTPEGQLANPNHLGAPLVLLVTAYQGDWVQAYVPLRPNEATAWVPRADVTISTDPYHIEIAIAAHELVLYKDNAAIFSTTVATGAPDSPTPTGTYFVAYIAKLTDPQDAYGPYAMGTSAFSNTYFSFEGGPGQVGIHGTNQPWVIGQYASHGCVRLTNAAITTIATQVPPGTPVEIFP